MKNERLELWNMLRDQGVVQADIPETTISDTPWFTKIITVFGSWLAALFLSISLGLFAYIFESSIISLLFGSILLYGCALLFKKESKSEFLSHMLLPLSLVGQLSIAVGIAQAADFIQQELLAVSLCCALIQIVLIKIMNNYIHRIWSTLMAALCLGVSLYEANLIFVIQPLFLGACVYLWWNIRRFSSIYSVVESIGYGLTISALGSIGYLHSELPQLIGLRAEFSEIITGGIFLGLIVLLLRKYAKSVSAILSISCILLSLGLVLLSYHAIGVTTTLSIIMLGFLNRNRFLMVIGGVSLLMCLSFYYYTLSITLLEKSFILALLSGSLLYVRSILQKSLHKKENLHAS